MSRITFRRVATLSVGVIASILTRRPTRPERPSVRRKRFLDSYALAAADPEFMQECAEVEHAFSHTLRDGLPRESFAN